MKKIAFFVQWMLCGGVENALISLSKELQKRGHEVTIYVITRKGEFIDKIPDGVALREIPMGEKVRRSIPVGGTKVSVRECLQNKKYVQAVKFLLKHKLDKGDFAELNIDKNKVPKLDKKYDIAVNYHMHSPFLVWYLSEKVDAEKKYTWIHNDFATTGYDIVKLKKYLSCVDGFYAVAENLANEFSTLMPVYRSITDVALNIVPVEEILEKGNMGTPVEFDSGINILTVGRLEEQKGYDIAVAVCEKLKKRGCVFKWYVLGNGTQKKWLSDEIDKKGLNYNMILLGTRMNPYPYFKNCTCYVQTSRHEGYVTTVTEAKIFSRPIVTTDVSGAREQLIDGFNGFITEISADSIAEKVEKLIRNKELREEFSRRLDPKEVCGELKWIDIFA